MIIHPGLPTRIAARIQAEPCPNPDLQGPCWIWLGRMNRNGYGRVAMSGREPVAHRAIYEILRETIPPGLVLDHRCRRRACVQPLHMEAVTHKVNLERGETIFFQKRVCERVAA